MEFNFGSFTNVQATSSVQPRLKPWEIHKVKFSGARIETQQGKKDPSQTYTILKTRFDGENGYYEESIFFPTDDELKDPKGSRPEYTSQDGHKYTGASAIERAMVFIAQVINALSPEGYKKYQAFLPKCKTFEDVAKGYINVTSSFKNKETKLKLVGKNSNGAIVAALPKFVAINKSGELFTCDNFIGDLVLFSDSQEAKRNEYLNAKPTNMSTVESNNTDSTDNLDFDSLL